MRLFFNSTIIMIAAGMKSNKKDFINNDLENMYFNYGLLGLASILATKGYTNIKVFQGDHKKIDDFITEIKNVNIDINSIVCPVFISIPSFFAIDWANDVIERLKKENNNIRIVVGGRWVIDQNLQWIQDKMPNVNFFVQGCPDEVIETLLDENQWTAYSNRKHIGNLVFSEFKYSLLNNYTYYQPSIEISRGCNNNCEFCLEKNYKVTGVKSAKNVIKEIKEICYIYGKQDLNFYFQAAMFNPTISWAREFSNEYKKNNLHFKWRFETRVDLVNVGALQILAYAGLKVIDFGLESASAQQLLRMNKTKNPDEYLKSAKAVLEHVYRFGIWAKLNILLYLGETEETINETMQWLDDVKFKGVSVNPFILYLNGKTTKLFCTRIKHLTGYEPNMKQLQQNGFTYVDLSSSINIENAKKWSKIISDKYMSPQDYIELKKICYLRNF